MQVPWTLSDASQDAPGRFSWKLHGRLLHAPWMFMNAPWLLMIAPHRSPIPSLSTMPILE
jgi:hypothetical protein